MQFEPNTVDCAERLPTLVLFIIVSIWVQKYE